MHNQWSEMNLVDGVTFFWVAEKEDRVTLEESILIFLFVERKGLFFYLSLFRCISSGGAYTDRLIFFKPEDFQYLYYGAMSHDHFLVMASALTWICSLDKVTH